MVVVFGSINLELIADVDELPRAGETRIGRSFAMSPGGKGANQALAAKRAGSNVALFGCVGDDAFAAPALTLLRDGGVDLDGVRASDAATGIALIHVDARGENTITVVSGANARASALCVPPSVLRRDTVVVVQLETPVTQVEGLAKRARASGARIVLNAAPAQPLGRELLDCVDVLIVNETEARVIAHALDIDADATTFAAHYRDAFGNETVVSLGARGVVASSTRGVIAVEPPHVDAVDTVGAGDALVGALAAALDRGTSWDRAIVEGVAAGSLACTRRGAQPSLPMRDAIQRCADTIGNELRRS